MSAAATVSASGSPNAPAAPSAPAGGGGVAAQSTPKRAASKPAGVVPAAGPRDPGAEPPSMADTLRADIAKPDAAPTDDEFFEALGGEDEDAGDLGDDAPDKSDEADGAEEPAAEVIEEDEEDPEMDRLSAQLTLAGLTRKQIKALQADPDAMRALASKLSGGAGDADKPGPKGDGQQQPAAFKDRIKAKLDAIKRFGDEFAPVADSVNEVVGEIETMRAAVAKEMDTVRQIVDRVYGQVESEVLLPSIRSSLTGTYGRVDDAAWGRVMAKAKNLAKGGKYNGLKDLLNAAAAATLRPRQAAGSQIRGQMTPAGKPKGRTPNPDTTGEDEFFDKHLPRRG